MILDTSYLIDLLRGKNENVIKKANELDNRFTIKSISSVSVMELWRGALQNLDSAAEKKKVNELINSLNILSFTSEVAKKAGEIEAELIKNGNMVDLEDIMIAATAMTRNEKVLTRNIQHFSRISGLALESY